MKKYILIGCGAAKQDGPAAARDLYVGSLFMQRRAYAESKPHPWWVVSAKFGLLSPAQVIKKYDCTMSQLSALDRMAWPLAVARDLISEFEEPFDAAKDSVVLHVGADYAVPLMKVFAAVGVMCYWPTQGMGIGKQMEWYAERLKREVVVS